MNPKDKATQWLNANNIDEESKKEISQLLKNPEELNEAFLKDLEFGTGGLRGIMGIGTNRLNKYTIGMATQGFANYLKNENNGEVSVAIAHDSRNHSRFFAETAANVFAANEIRVFLFEDLRPTPELSFAIRTLGCQGGVVLTASHNPKEYNGYKAYWSDGGQLVSPHDKNVIAEVSKMRTIDNVRFDADKSLIQIIGEDMDKAYIDMLKELSLLKNDIIKSSHLKIVYSSIHGTGITLIPRILEELGFSEIFVVEAQAKPDGNFPTVIYPNPEEKEAMSMALAYGKEKDADLVLATDPDADRVGIAVKNTKGEYQLLNGNQTAVLLIYYLLNKWQERGLKGNEFIAKTIVTTELIQDIAKAHNITCYDTLTGFKWIADLIKRLEGKEVFIGGGEESYGYLIGDKVRDKDAVASAMIIAEMAAWAKNQDMSVFELLVSIYRKYGVYHEALKSITKKGLKGEEEIKNMMQDFRSSPPAYLAGSPVETIIDYQSGTKKTAHGETIVDLPKSNVLQYITSDGTKVSIRPSGTEPKIKFYFSVKGKIDGDDYYKAEKELSEKIHNLLIDLKL
ncbi:MAG: phospho-sugar mutase [Ekhidna sp.]|nr:phospho-sugar mutase [Ekhidna sp.]MBC6410295.1 phospho-sugar mutase [Ekhidna sp.]